MKVLKNMLAVGAAVAMVGAPVMASAAPASKLSVAQVSKARAGTKGKKASELVGGSTIIALLAAAAVVGGIAVASGGGGSKAKSP
jgi:hypothetical protein